VRLKEINLKSKAWTIEIDIAFIEIDILSKEEKRNPMMKPTRAATNMGDDNARL
jgi:5-methylthioribose kinase